MGHIIEAPGGIEARPEAKAQITGHQPITVPSGHLQEREDTGPAKAGAHPHEALMHQYPIDPIEGYHVRHGAQGHEVEPGGHIGLGNTPLGKPTPRPQAAPKGGEQEENHPHPRQVLGGEGTTRLVGIDDGIGRRKLAAGQVVIGDDNPEPRRLRGRHPLETGDAVINGNQQVRRLS